MKINIYGIALTVLAFVSTSVYAEDDICVTAGYCPDNFQSSGTTGICYNGGIIPQGNIKCGNIISGVKPSCTLNGNPIKTCSNATTPPTSQNPTTAPTSAKKISKVCVTAGQCPDNFQSNGITGVCYYDGVIPQGNIKCDSIMNGVKPYCTLNNVPIEACSSYNSDNKLVGEPLLFITIALLQAFYNIN